MNIFDTMITYYQTVGIFDFGIPFILTFAVVFSLLNKANIFGNKRIDLIVALSISFMILPFFPKVSFGPFLTSFFGKAIIVFILIVAVGMVSGLGNQQKIIQLVSIIGIIAIVAFFVSSGGLELLGINARGGVSLPYVSPEMLTGVIFLIFVLVAIAAIAGIGPFKGGEGGQSGQEGG